MSQNHLAKSVFGAGGGLVTLLIGFICSILVARFLGPEANGLVSYALWLCMVGSVIAELGTSMSMLHFLPMLAAQGKDDSQRRQFAAYLSIPVVVMTGLLLVLCLVLMRLTHFAESLQSSGPVLLLTAVLFVFQAVGSPSRLYLSGDLRNRTFFFSSLLSAVLQLAVIVGGLFWGVAGALTGYIAGQTLNFLTTLWLLARKPSSCGISRKHLIEASFLNFFETGISIIFLNRPEIFLLERFDTLESVGLYSVALTMVNLTLQIPIQFSGNLVSYYSLRRETGNADAVSEMFVANIRYFSFITLPTCFGLAAIAKTPVQLIFGDDYTSASQLIIALSLFAPATVFVHLSNQYAFSMGRYKFRLGMTVLASAAMLVGCVMVIPVWGALGAAILRGFVTVALMTLYIVGLQLGQPLLKVTSALARIAVSAALCGLAALAVTSMLPGWLGLVLAVSAGILVYFTALRATSAVTTEDVAHLEKGMSALPMSVKRAVRWLV